MASGAVLKVHSWGLPSREYISMLPPATHLQIHQGITPTMLSLGCSQSMTEHGQSSRAGPFLPGAEWAIFALELQLSQSCSAVLGSSHPILVPSLFSQVSDLHHVWKILCIFCSPSFLSSKGIPLNQSLAHLLPSWCLPGRGCELMQWKVSQASLCQIFV